MSKERDLIEKLFSPEPIKRIIGSPKDIFGPLGVGGRKQEAPPEENEIETEMTDSEEVE